MHIIQMSLILYKKSIKKSIEIKNLGEKRKKTRKEKEKLKSKARSENSEAKPFI